MAYEHAGHRERLRAELMRLGEQHFSDTVLLEYMLFYCLPRRDTRKLAEALLSEFGRLDIVFDATPEDLMQVPGVGRETAMFLNMIPQICRRYMQEKHSGTKITNSISAARYMVPLFMYEQKEVVYAVCLDSGGNILGQHRISSGLPQISAVNTDALMHYAVSKHAASVVLAHNHIGGCLLPSREDEVTTSNIAKQLRLLNISLLDHIIVSGNEYISMLDGGFLLEK